MARDTTLNVSVGIIAAVMICVAASQASDVFAPLALALFIIALVWPLQSWLHARMPALLALAITNIKRRPLTIISKKKSRAGALLKNCVDPISPQNWI